MVLLPCSKCCGPCWRCYGKYNLPNNLISNCYGDIWPQFIKFKSYMTLDGMTYREPFLPPPDYYDTSKTQSWLDSLEFNLPLGNWNIPDGGGFGYRGTGGVDLECNQLNAAGSPISH